MTALFGRILQMSLTGSVVIAVVLGVRMLLKRAPKIYSYLLWSVVLFRLLCPFSISAGVSVLEPINVESKPGVGTVSFAPIRQAVEEVKPAAETVSTPKQEREKTAPSLMEIGAFVWIAGAAAMGIYGLVQYVSLKRRLSEAVPASGQFYLADGIPSPFVMGVIRPKVYLPSDTPEEERRFILAHERHHIRRQDPLWKLLEYIALCLHWFNPLVWLSFVLAGKDMEMSCDEAVIKRLGEEIRADYAQALLRLATHKRIPVGMPLAFGEGDTKGRVKNMALWKKPKVWVSVLCAVACLGILAFCALNPKQEETATVKNDPEPGIPLSYEVDSLPEGYTYETGTDGNILLYNDSGSLVGGTAVYTIPHGVYDPNDEIFLWLEDVGIPDLEDPNLMIDGTFAWGGGNGCATTVSDDFENPTLRRTHNFTVSGNQVYDLWLDDLAVDTNIQFDIKDAVHLVETAGAAETTAPELTQEDIAFNRCHNIMNTLQEADNDVPWLANGVHIRREYSYRNTPSENKTEDYYWDAELGFLRCTTKTNGETLEELYAQGRYFVNNGSGWQETEVPRQMFGPWLGSFYFVRKYATYLDTQKSRDADSGAEIETDMFRIDAEFWENGSSPYYADFEFDSQGNFRKVCLQINAAQDDAYNLTESVVLNEEQSASEKILQEFENATQ